MPRSPRDPVRLHSSLGQHDATAKGGKVSIRSGEVRLHPGRLRHADSRKCLGHPRGELNSQWVLIGAGGLLPGTGG
jgi:hypothetical protein